MKNPKIAIITDGEFYDYWLDSLKVHAPILSRSKFYKREDVDRAHFDHFKVIIFFLMGQWDLIERTFDIELLNRAASLSDRGSRVFFLTRIPKFATGGPLYQIASVCDRKLILPLYGSSFPEVEYEFSRIDGKCRIVKEPSGRNSYPMIDWKRLYKYIKVYL